MATLPAGIASTPGSNRFSRITKASAAVRLILVRSRRSDGRREEWSGLSESNRHLNLGKVPYYHYTKAAQRLSFYNMPARQPQAFPTPTGVGPNAAKARLVRKPGLSWRTSPPASGAGALRSGEPYP